MPATRFLMSHNETNAKLLVYTIKAAYDLCFLYRQAMIVDKSAFYQLVDSVLLQASIAIVILLTIFRLVTIAVALRKTNTIDVQ